MNTGIRQDDHLILKLSDQRLTGRIVDIGRVTVPIDDQAQVIQDKSEFPADDPAMIRSAFLANLPGTAPFTHGVQPFDAIRVGDAQQRRFSQETVRPVLVSFEQPKQPAAFG